MDLHENNSIPEGPGLISGKKGGWTIFRIEEKKKTPKEETETDSDDQKSD